MANREGAPSLRLLGPVEIWADGRSPLSPGGAKPRGLLALLMVDCGRPVSMDRLVDGLWHDPPASAVNAVQVQVSMLRRQLPPGMSILWTGGGYTLDAAPDEVDVTLFERRATAGSTAQLQGLSEEALTCCRQAMDLWRGEPLQGVGDLPFVEPLAQYLTERRDLVDDLAGELLIALGRPAEAVATLEPLVARTPHREHRWALLVRALGASGRAADGLGAFQRARRVLLDELGLEPGAELHDAEQEVLAGGQAAAGEPEGNTHR